MNAIFGWGLALVALVAGWVGYGWPGVAMAVSVVVFWLLLQFSRAVRVMRMAATRPMGRVASAVMLQAQLRPGLTMMKVVTLTRSLGQRQGDSEDTWRWQDEGGAAVVLHFAQGKLVSWALERP
jgi:hypothetical protein